MHYLNLDLDFYTDPKFVEMMDTLGRDGVAVWLYFIAQYLQNYKGDPGQEVEIYEPMLCRNLRLTPQKLHRHLTVMARTFGFRYTKVGRRLLFSYPKLLKKQRYINRTDDGKFAPSGSQLEVEEEEKKIKTSKPMSNTMNKKQTDKKNNLPPFDPIEINSDSFFNSLTYGHQEKHLPINKDEFEGDVEDDYENEEIDIELDKTIYKPIPF